MENATKALTMAASILIAIMVIALIYMLVNKISETAEQDELQLKAEQTAKFNKEFESYEKSLMRGTEVITVINKAIVNNNRYDNSEKVNDIDVQFILKTPVTSVTVKVSNGEVLKSKEETEFESDKVYKLIDNTQKDRINAELKEFMKLGAIQESSDGGIITEWEDERNYTKVYDEFKVFKRKLFKCKSIEYNQETGRVCLLVFEELKQSNELEGYN